MTLGTILLIILVLLLLGALPTWGHSRSWGYMPSGTLVTTIVFASPIFVAMLSAPLPAWPTTLMSSSRSNARASG